MRASLVIRTSNLAPQDSTPSTVFPKPNNRALITIVASHFTGVIHWNSENVNPDHWL